ncbi:hypothetical protein LEMLEM_LOCUS10123, partial [Lemmus lemmus]
MAQDHHTRKSSVGILRCRTLDSHCLVSDLKYNLWTCDLSFLHRHQHCDFSHQFDYFLSSTPP